MRPPPARGPLWACHLEPTDRVGQGAYKLARDCQDLLRAPAGRALPPGWRALLATAAADLLRTLRAQAHEGASPPPDAPLMAAPRPPPRRRETPGRLRRWLSRWGLVRWRYAQGEPVQVWYEDGYGPAVVIQQRYTRRDIMPPLYEYLVTRTLAPASTTWEAEGDVFTLEELH